MGDTDHHLVADAPEEIDGELHRLESGVLRHVDAHQFGARGGARQLEAAVGQQEALARPLLSTSDARRDTDGEKQNEGGGLEFVHGASRLPLDPLRLASLNQG